MLSQDKKLCICIGCISTSFEKGTQTYCIQAYMLLSVFKSKCVIYVLDRFTNNRQNVLCWFQKGKQNQFQVCLFIHKTLIILLSNKIYRCKRDRFDLGPKYTVLITNWHTYLTLKSSVVLVIAPVSMLNLVVPVIPSVF